jgi:hypothetical protein
MNMLIQNMTARYIMSRILSEIKNMARSARMLATSGWVTRRVRRGLRCVWRVRVMPRPVERRVRSGLAREMGRRRGRKDA